MRPSGKTSDNGLPAITMEEDMDRASIPDSGHPPNRLVLKKSGARSEMTATEGNSPVLEPGDSVPEVNLGEPGLLLKALTAIVHSAGMPEMIGTLTRMLKDITGVEAIGVRLKDGDDYPYYETCGFPLHFVRQDNELCTRDQKGGVVCGHDGRPILGCLCGNVIRGLVEPGEPYFTSRGSFWTNSLAEFLASPAGRRLPEATRNRMAGNGYESVALVPIGSARKNIGLVQFNDPRPGLFSSDLVDQFEHIAEALSYTIPRRLLRDDLEASRRNLLVARDELEVEVQRRTEDLVTANERLRREAEERRLAQQELEKTNKTLRVERSMLENKNIALKEIMEQIDQYKRSTSQQLQANVNRVIRPMLQLLTAKLSPADRRLVSLLDNTLQDLIDPFVGKLESLSYSLTPREMEVCHMIRNGFSSKQIASLLNVSVFTVNNQRRSIRRKLEIADGETHLESYLKRL